MKIIFSLLLLGCAMLLGVYAGMQVVGRGILPTAFWDMKFIQIFDIAVSITLAVGVTAVITKQLNYSLKQRELVAGCITEYEGALCRVYDSYSTYTRSPNKEQAQEILRLHKATSNSLTIMLSVLKTVGRNNKSETHENCYLRLKGATTDSPFGLDKKPVVDTARLDKIDTAFCEARKELVAQKLALYR